MKIIKQIDDITEEVKGFIHASVALVPTMGSLHKGHGELIKAARKRCDKVIVSIFVNPAQFDDPRDLRDYPRAFDDDVNLARSLGADIVFAPNADDLYQGDDSTWVIVDGLGDRLCGASRVGHFRGVATIVAKLFNIVRPGMAFFGEKDWQQILIIKKMVMDLHIPVEIISLPTVREASGLAISSRNSRLSNKEKRDAEIIWRSLTTARDDIYRGNKEIRLLRKLVGDMIESNESFELEYISFCRPSDLIELESLEIPLLIAIAAKAGNTRLIDNLLVS